MVIFCEHCGDFCNAIEVKLKNIENENLQAGITYSLNCSRCGRQIAINPMYEQYMQQLEEAIITATEEK